MEKNKTADTEAFKRQKDLIYKAALAELSVRAKDLPAGERIALVDQCVDSLTTQYLNLLNNALNPLKVYVFRDKGILKVESPPLSHQFETVDNHQIYEIVNHMCENIHNLFGGSVPIGFDYESN